LWEKNYAFLPGYVRLTQGVEGLLQLITRSENVKGPLVLLLVAANKVLTAVSAAYLYRIACSITGNPRIGRAAATVFLFNPASIFYHSVYSEPLYCCCTFLAIHILLERKKLWMKCFDHPISFFRECGSSLALLGLSVGIRTTAMLLSLVPGIPMLLAFGKSLSELKLLRVFKIGVTGVATILTCIALFAMYLF